MLPAASHSMHMICGGAPLEFAGANHIQHCCLAIVAISAIVSDLCRFINWYIKDYSPHHKQDHREMQA